MITKRRTVWLNDDDWLALEAAAAERRVNVSQYLRTVATRRRQIEPADELPTLHVPPVHVAPLPAPDWEGMKRDAQGVADRARAIANEPNPYLRPFTPAPKPGKR